MISLLAKLFLPKGEAPSSPRLRTAYGTLCSVTGIFLNLLLFGFKYLAGVLTGSVAVMADAFNNLSDSGSSAVTLLGFRIAAKKADPHHPFGHGRYEYLSGVAVSVVIVFMGWELLKSAWEKLFHPVLPETGTLSLIILAVSIAVKLYMAFYNRSIGKAIGSGAMQATAQDCLGDCLSTALVLLSMLCVRFWGINPDAWCGLAISLFVILGGLRSFKETLDPLLGTAPEKEFIDQIRALLKEYPEIIGVHDLIVHDYGPGRRMLSLHAEVSGKGDIFALHDLIDTVEKRLTRELSCEAVIHMDPVADDDEKTERLKKEMLRGLRELLDPDVSLHDFRIVDGPTHTNLIFDVVLPAQCSLSNKAVRRAADEICATLEGTCYAVVTVDRNYTGE